MYHMVEEALKIKHKPATYMNEGFCWDSTIFDLGGISCFELGMFQKSYEFTKTALEMAPNDKRLKSNLEIIKEKVGL